MLQKYAIEPDVLVTWDKCRNTLNLMGFQHGRAIVAYPSWKKWKRMILDACNRSPSLGEREFKRIYEKLLDSERKLVLADRLNNYDGSIFPTEERWIRNATAHQDAAGTFRAILATRNPVFHPDVVIEEDIDETHSKLDVPREELVFREPEAAGLSPGRQCLAGSPRHVQQSRKVLRQGRRVHSALTHPSLAAVSSKPEA